MMRDYGFVDYGFVFNEEVLKVFYDFNKDNFDAKSYKEISTDDIISFIGDDLVAFAPDGSYEVSYIQRMKDSVGYEDYFAYTPLSKFPSLTKQAYKNDREYIEEITNELKDYFPKGFDFSRHIAFIIGAYCG